MKLFLKASGITLAFFIGCTAVAYLMIFAVSLSDAGHKLLGLSIFAGTASVVVGGCVAGSKVVADRILG